MFKSLGLLVVLSITFFTGGKKAATRLTAEIQEPVQSFQNQSAAISVQTLAMPPEARPTHPAAENSALSQTENKPVKIDEHAIQLGSTQMFLYMRVINPCPTNDEQMGLPAANPGLNPDPGIQPGVPGQFTVVPGDLEKDCGQASTGNIMFGK